MVRYVFVGESTIHRCTTFRPCGEESRGSRSRFYSRVSCLAVGDYCIRARRQDVLHCCHSGNEKSKSDCVYRSYARSWTNDHSLWYVVAIFVKITFKSKQVREVTHRLCGHVYRVSE